MATLNVESETLNVKYMLTQLPEVVLFDGPERICPAKMWCKDNAEKRKIQIKFRYFFARSDNIPYHGDG